MNKDFFWGTATAATQIEGAAFEDGKGLTNWDVIPTIKGTTYQGQDVKMATDHYHHVDEDVSLIKELGTNAYRFSINWSRVIDIKTGKPNEKGLAFYGNLVDKLLQNGIEPFVTIFHWDLPYEYYMKGGWLNPDSPKWFLEYVKVLATYLKGKVKYYITLNEPQCILGGSGGVVQGGNYSTKERMQMIHHLLLAHGLATRYLHTLDGVKVGIAPCCIPVIPTSNKKEDIELARKAMFTYHLGSTWDITVWSDPIMFGRYPDEYINDYSEFEKATINEGDMEIISEPIDFYCQNIYTGMYVVKTEKGEIETKNAPIGTSQTCMGWDVIPEALYWGPKFLYERYKKPFFITENGCAVTDLVTKDKKVHDSPRIEFLRSYIEQYLKAIEDGVDGRGYFVWSLLDNFEWSSAYSKRFGLVYVNYQTFERIKKDSFYYYKQVIQSNGDIVKE